MGKKLCGVIDTVELNILYPNFQVFFFFSKQLHEISHIVFYDFNSIGPKIHGHKHFLLRFKLQSYEDTFQQQTKNLLTQQCK